MDKKAKLTPIIVAFTVLSVTYYSLNLTDKLDKKITTLEENNLRLESSFLKMKNECHKVKEENEELQKELQTMNQTKVEKVQKEPIKKPSRGGRLIKGPVGGSSFKSYMDYRAITNTDSKQYELQKSATTNNQGFRVLNDRIMVALGSGFGNVGDLVDINIGGEVFGAVIGDQKADKHTDSTNTYHLSDKSVVEFIVDRHKLESNIKKMGDCSFASQPMLKGRVIEIKNLSNQ